MIAANLSSPILTGEPPGLVAAKQPLCRERGRQGIGVKNIGGRARQRTYSYTHADIAWPCRDLSPHHTITEAVHSNCSGGSIYVYACWLSSGKPIASPSDINITHPERYLSHHGLNGSLPLYQTR